MKCILHAILRWTRRTVLVILTLLCIVTAALWVRSYWWADSLMLGGQDRPNRVFSSVPARLYFTSINGCLYSERFHWYSDKLTGKFDDYSPSDWFGFAVWSDSITLKIHPGMAPMSEWGLRMPYWFPILLTGSLPSLGLVLVIRGRRRERRWGVEGRCRQCGYDLRASKDRCPECGTEIVHPASKT